MMIRGPLLRVLPPGVRSFSAARCTVDERPEAPRVTQQASLYVHWPYCLRRCTYCNFNKYIPKENKDHLITKCLLQETETLLQLSGVSRITSVFFGGGTPSLAPPSTIAAILESVSKLVNLSHDAEVTIEVNPTPAGMSKLEDFCSAGVNRFSIGVQDEDLKVLGRDHSSRESLQTIAEARRLCPGRVSVDMMFGRPRQSVESWEKELAELLEICDDHVSLYQLTLERGTQLFKQVHCGVASVPGDDVTADMYHSARRTLQQHGFLQYEVSNFARHKVLALNQLTIVSTGTRKEAVFSFHVTVELNSMSGHNMSYWKGEQYIGVGPGAHGRFVPVGEGGLDREARTQTLEPDVWMREVQQSGHGTRRRTHLSHLQLLEEVLVMGMRMTKGITNKHWELFSPHMSLQEVFGASSDVQELLRNQRLILNDRGLRCSWDGLALLDSILPTLLVELEKQTFLKPH